MGNIDAVAVAAIAFVGSHLALSHPLRRPLVSRIGENAFAGVYSLVAALTLAALVVAYRRAPAGVPLWAVGDGIWAVATAVMLFASVLLVGSLVGNPALPNGGRAAVAPPLPRGVYAVTRHPMMWSFALWGASHALVFPVGKNIVLGTAIVALALAGAAGQDAKKRRLQPAFWPVWTARTSFLPFGAILDRRARLGGFGAHALGGGTILWLVATWAHGPLAGWPAGIWRWL